MSEKYKRLNEDEWEALTACYLFVCATDRYISNLRPRVKEFGIKNGSQDIGMAKHCINRVYEKILDTVPDNQLKRFINDMRSAGYHIGVKRPGGSGGPENDYGTYVGYSDLEEMLGAILENKCRYCAEDLQGQRKCKMRKLINGFQNDYTEFRNGRCPYLMDCGER